MASFLCSEGISVEAIDVRFIKPLSCKLFDFIKQADLVFTLEENAVLGGFGSSVLEKLSELDKTSISKINIIGIEDLFVGHAARNELLKQCKLDFETVLKRVIIEIIKTLSSRKEVSKESELRLIRMAENFSEYEKRTH